MIERPSTPQPVGPLRAGMRLILIAILLTLGAVLADWHVLRGRGRVATG